MLPLLWADKSILERALKLDPNLDPIFIDIQSNDINTLKSRLDNSNINTSTIWGATPLQVAVFYGNKDIVQLLLNKGADPHASIPCDLREILLSGDKNLIQPAYDLNLNSAFISCLTIYDISMFACQVNQPQLVNLLAKSKWNKQKFDEADYFFQAVMNGDILAVQNELEKGVDIDTVTVWGGTALHLAIIHKNDDMIKFLIENGANVDLPIPDESFPPFSSAKELAAKENLPEIVTYINEYDKFIYKSTCKISSESYENLDFLKKAKKSIEYAKKVAFIGRENVLADRAKQAVFQKKLETDIMVLYGKKITLVRM